MTDYGMIVDVSRCQGCYNCFLACRDEFVGNEYPSYSAAQPFKEQYWIEINEDERGEFPYLEVSFVPVPCMHCNDAPCVDASSAVYMREDGIVMIDPNEATGEKQLLSACPYGKIFWNEEENLPQKCTFCAHLLDERESEPRCVEACPTDALIFGDMDDPDSEISKAIKENQIEELHPEIETNPKVRYINLPKPFVCGTVLFEDNNEAAEGINVNLKDKSGKKFEEKETDGFGDFKFGDLKKGRTYLIEVENGDNPKKIEIDLKKSKYLGKTEIGKK